MSISSSDVKAIFQKIGAILVVAALGIACFASTTDEAMRSEEYGKMIAISTIYDEPSVDTAVTKLPYSSIGNQQYEKDQLSQMEIVENESGGTLLAEANAGMSDEEAALARDKAALQAILNADRPDSEKKQQAKEQATKYTLNEITEAASIVITEITPGGVITSGASGQKVMAGTSQYGEYLGQYVCTAYCPCVICCEKTNGITASGELATANHTVATDSRFSFGTKLIIDGQVYVVEDRGGAIQGNRIDIYFNTHQEALNFGVHTLDVYYVK